MLMVTVLLIWVLSKVLWKEAEIGNHGVHGEILWVLQKDIQQNLELKKSGFFIFMSSAGKILSVYVRLYGYMVGRQT
jgi:hypothetical protein